MQRNIMIEIDYASWPSQQPPAAIINLGNYYTRIIHVGVCLLHTALWTRPPDCYGFSLADFWAWIRYAPAIDNSEWLQLRSEWEYIDAHQKTILSDELGVGFTTEFFVTNLNFILFADTNYYINVYAPNTYTLKTSAKRGPKKSPDYISCDVDGKIHILECKGSQSSQAILLDAINKGIRQKENIQPASDSSIGLSLVAGLFIPQNNSPEQALIHIKDPDLKEQFDILKTYNADERLIGIIQIALAKHFALMGLFSISSSLANRKIEQKYLKNIDQDELKYLRIEEGFIIFETQSLIPLNQLLVKGIKVRQIKFTMKCPQELYKKLIEEKDLNKYLHDLLTQVLDRKWKSNIYEDGVEVVSPLDFILILKFL